MELKKFKKVDMAEKTFWIVAIWYFINYLLIKSYIPGSSWRITLLRMFGSSLGKGIVIKPGVRVKFPWKLKIGDFSWIGEDVWIDNIDFVEIGSNCCISQGTYFCTGNHNFASEAFDLISEPIIIKDKSWVGAKCIIGPGVIIKEKSFYKLGDIIKKVG